MNTTLRQLTATATIVVNSMVFASELSVDPGVPVIITDRSTASSRHRTDSDSLIFYEDWETGDLNGWTTVDQTDISPAWHLDTFEAFSGSGTSWWVGDSSILPLRGYANERYFGLDSPPILLPSVNPILTFWHRYKSEDPAGASAPYDGWDGMNLRISTDNGNTWEIVASDLLNPPYDRTSLYSFGFQHGEGANVPGWCGANETWHLQTVNLISRAGQEIRLRFAFASDAGVSTMTDSTLFGWMFDNVRVYSGNDTSFLDDGNNPAGWNSVCLTPVIGNLWHLAIDSTSPAGHHVIACNDEATGQYRPGMDDWLISPLLDLQQFTHGSCTADFWMVGQLPWQASYEDMYTVMVSTDSGQTWCYSSNPTCAPGVPACCLFASCPYSWNSFNEVWPNHRLAISEVLGNVVQFAIRFISQDDSVVGSGIRIDGFSLTYSDTNQPSCDLSGSLPDTVGPDTCHVTGDIFVSAGDTTVILPGTVLMFDGPYGLSVSGTLLAIGTVQDSIRFLPQSPGLRWNGVTLDGAPGTTIKYCRIEGITGPGVEAYNSSPTIQHTLITNCTGANWGGGLYLQDCAGMIDSCAIVGNTATANGGGMMLRRSSPTIRNTYIAFNHADWGGAILCYDNGCNPLIENCIIEHNIATGGGGGLEWDAYIYPTVRNCLIRQNQAPLGGGIYLHYYGAGEFEFCTIVGNQADSGAGILSYGSGNRAFRDCIVAYSLGQGMQFSSNANLQIMHCDVFGNSAGDHFGSLPPGFADSTTTNANGDSCDQYFNIFVDPLFADTASGDYHILPESPCIAAGDSIGAPVTDIVGSPRPNPVGTLPDIGAYESPYGTPAPVGYAAVAGHVTLVGGTGDVTQVLVEADGLGDPSTHPFADGTYLLDSVQTGWRNLVATLPDYSVDTAYAFITGDTLGDLDFTLHYLGCQLAGALRDTIGPDTCYVVDNIEVDAGDTLVILPGTVLWFDGHYSITIGGNLQAVGTETDSIIFTSSTSYADRWQNLRFVNSQDTSRLAYCRLQYGRPDQTEPYNYGGAIFAITSTVDIRHCTVAGNEAYHGGGLYITHNSHADIVDCVIRQNIALFSGGGIFIQEDAQVRVDRCEITDNTASHHGGGVFVYNAQPLICNSLLQGNVATQFRGGGVSFYDYPGSGGTVASCTIIGNEAPAGGGVYISGFAPTVIGNSIIAYSVGSGLASNFAPDSMQIRYNDVYGNSGGAYSGSFPEGFGNTSYVNANSDSCDVYYNIFMDPMFADTSIGDFSLVPESPCIAAGDSSSAPSLDIEGSPRPNPVGTLPDIGAYESPYPIAGNFASVSGTVTLLGGPGEVTQVVVRADSAGGRTTNPLSDGNYLLDSLEIGPHVLYASLPSFSIDTAYVSLTAEGLQGVDFVLIWRCELAGSLRDTIGPDTCYVVDNIQVDAGDTLVILPGTTLMFEGDYRMYVYGLLAAVGGIADSIRFTCNTSIVPDGWGGILLQGPNDNISSLLFCVVEHANGTNPGNRSAVHCFATTLDVQHSTFRGNRGWLAGALICNAFSTVTVDSSLIEGNLGELCSGIFSSGCSPVIMNSVLTGNAGGAVLSVGQGAPYIGHCMIVENALSSFALQCNAGSSPLVDRCKITGNGSVYHGSTIVAYGASTPSFRECTISNNRGGVHLWQSVATVSGCIISFNGSYAIQFSYDEGSTIEYSCIQGLILSPWDGVLPIGLDTIVMSNLNGDSCDIYYNIFMDPMFVDTANGDYHLQVGSPCIDAGDPELPCDPDYTLSDIGAFYYHQDQLPAPSRLVIQTTNRDVVLTWVPAIQCPLDSGGVVIYYLVFHGSSANGDFVFLASTSDTTYVHEDIVQFSSKMFYEVTTYAGPPEVLASLRPGMKHTEIMHVLRQTGR